MLHETDFYSWTQEQTALLRQGLFSNLDVANLIEEIEDMGISQRRALESRLIVLLMHLLKWKYQPDHRSNSWRATIKRQRTDLQDLLQQNPGLKPSLPQQFIKAYPKSLLDAVSETNLDESTFPTTCPWSLTQVLNNEFWPD